MDNKLIAIISDIHFEDNDNEKNLPPEVYESFMQQLEYNSWRYGVEEVHLYFAGDIFEISRSKLWLTYSKKPYMNPKKEDLLEITNNVFKSIINTERVKQSLEIIRRYVNKFRVPIHVHYIPGNHDRLLNYYIALRGKVRESLGMDVNFYKFPNAVEVENLLIRHGHEYDKYNFGQDLAGKSIPLSPEGYEKPTMGELLTLELAARIPYEFYNKYKEEIEKGTVPRNVLEKIRNVDDVRPRSAILSYLIEEDEDIWPYLQPILSNVANNIRHNKLFWKVVDKGPLGKVQETALKTAIWMLSRNWVAKHMKWYVKKVINIFTSLPSGRRIDIESFTKSEETSAKYIICGHSHQPGVGVFDSDKYWIDIGTWRNVIHGTKDGKHFGMSKSWTYVLITNKGFDFWTGYSEHD